MTSRKRWRAVPGWPGYKVSSRGGQVRSVPRQLADGRDHGGQALTPVPDRDGYLYVTLTDGSRRWRVSVAELVLTAFDRPRPAGLEACHGPDGNQVNDLDCLRWDTRRENEKDKMRERRRKTEQNRTGVCSPLRAMTPVTGVLSLTEAVTSGVVLSTLPALRMCRHLDPAFPGDIGRRGASLLYDAAELAEYDRQRHL